MEAIHNECGLPASRIDWMLHKQGSSEVGVLVALFLLLVIGAHSVPGACVQFLRITGTDLADPVSDEQDVDGPLAELIRRVDEKLQAHNSTAVNFTSRSIERRRSTYPLAALQQIVRNAIMHRTCEGTNAPARITWYDDRIEVLSSGGPYGSVYRQLPPGAVRRQHVERGHALRSGIELYVLHRVAAAQLHATPLEPLPHGHNQRVVLVQRRAQHPLQPVHAGQQVNETVHAAAQFSQAVPRLERKHG